MGSEVNKASYPSDAALIALSAVQIPFHPRESNARNGDTNATRNGDTALFMLAILFTQKRGHGTFHACNPF